MMSGLTAWVPLWDKCPELVPAAWHKIDMNGGEEGEPLHIVWARCTGRGETYTYKPESPEPIDIDAQIGRAVQWLAKKAAKDGEPGCLVQTNADGAWAADWCREPQWAGDLLTSLRLACEDAMRDAP